MEPTSDRKRQLAEYEDVSSSKRCKQEDNEVIVPLTEEEMNFYIYNREVDGVPCTSRGQVNKYVDDSDTEESCGEEEKILEAQKTLLINFYGPDKLTMEPVSKDTLEESKAFKEAINSKFRLAFKKCRNSINLMNDFESLIGDDKNPQIAQAKFGLVFNEIQDIHADLRDIFDQWLSMLNNRESKIQNLPKTIRQLKDISKCSISQRCHQDTCPDCRNITFSY